MAGVERRNGYLHINARGEAAHRLFGMDGFGISFNCDACGDIVKSRLPWKAGLDCSKFYCSLPCAMGFTVSLPEAGCMVRWSRVRSEWLARYGDDPQWYPVVQDSTLELMIWSTDECIAVMEKETRPK